MYPGVYWILCLVLVYNRSNFKDFITFDSRLSRNHEGIFDNSILRQWKLLTRGNYLKKLDWKSCVWMLFQHCSTKEISIWKIINFPKATVITPIEYFILDLEFTRRVLSNCPCVCVSVFKTLRDRSLVFLIFCMKLGHHRQQKWQSPIFEKNLGGG